MDLSKNSPILPPIPLLILIYLPNSHRFDYVRYLTHRVFPHHPSNALKLKILLSSKLIQLLL